MKVGDRVEVKDEGLAAIRAIMRDATGQEPPPNNTGVIEELYEDAALVLFDDTLSVAPYPLADIILIAPSTEETP